MDRKEVARQLRQEAAELLKAADLLEGKAPARRGRPPGSKNAAKKPGRKAGQKRVGRKPMKRSAKKAAATTE